METFAGVPMGLAAIPARLPVKQAWEAHTMTDWTLPEQLTYAQVMSSAATQAIAALSSTRRRRSSPVSSSISIAA